MPEGPQHDRADAAGGGPSAAPQGRPWASLAAVLALAVAVRLIGLGWGLPDIDSRPDENLMIKVALQFGTGDLNPHFFGYPTLLADVLFVCYVALAGFWKLTGSIHSPGDILNLFARDASAFFLTARLVSAVAGTATVGAVYLLGRRAYGTRVGLAAAFILAVAFLPVRDSHFGTVDPLMVCLATFSLLPTWDVYTRGRRGDYLRAGVLVGLAASTKYYGVAAAVAIVAAHLLRPRQPGEPARHLDLILAGLVSALAFLAATPYIALSPGEFLKDFHRHVFTLQAGDLEVHYMRAWKFHFLYTLPRGLTLPIFLAGLAGLIGAFVSDWRRALVLFSYPLAFYALIGWSWVGVARYTTATLPFLALAAGWLLVRVAEAGRSLGWGPRLCGRAAAALVVLACSYSMIEVGNLLRLFCGADTRRQAATWAVENLPDGATIGWLGTGYGRPPLPQRPESLERRLAMATSGSGYSGTLIRKKIELARAGRAPQFMVFDLGRDPSRWEGELPEYLLLEHYRLFWVEKEAAFAGRWLEEGGYNEVRRWAVTGPGEPLPYCDPQDAVYLPFGHLGRVRSSGPELILYQRRDRDGRPPVRADLTAAAAAQQSRPRTPAGERR